MKNLGFIMLFIIGGLVSWLVDIPEKVVDFIGIVIIIVLLFKLSNWIDKVDARLDDLEDRFSR